MLECVRLFDATHLQRLSEGAPQEKRLDINALRQQAQPRKAPAVGLLILSQRKCINARHSNPVA